MGAADLFHHKGHDVRLARCLDPERERWEQELLQRGVPLPLPHRLAWARAHGDAGIWFLAVHGPDGMCRDGFAAEVHRSRALPGHLLLRVEHLSAGPDAQARAAGLAALTRLARQSPRVLRVNVEVAERDPAARAALAEALRGEGFRPATNPRLYIDTLAVDLTPDEDTIFRSLHSSARRKIRAPEKLALSVRPITDPRLGGRLNELLDETLRRSGERYQSEDWSRRIEFSRAHLALSRLVGLFRTDVPEPAALVAFAWGCHHTDCAEYRAAASTRAADLRAPLHYSLMWDLLRWAKANGAWWFDLGGIRPGHWGGDDPLGGVSDFKRFFSKQVVQVGGEWVFEPHRVRSTLARLISAGARLGQRFARPPRSPRS